MRYTSRQILAIYANQILIGIAEQYFLLGASYDWVDSFQLEK